jgi:hypothetical protein
MAKLSSFSVSMILVLLMTAGTGRAFYLIDEKRTESADFAFKTDGNALWEEGEKFFALYDNFKQISEKHPGDPLIFPHTNTIVPADLIPCDMPLYAFLRRGEISGDPISEMLYANLKLKKLIEEYISLREKSRELLEGLEVSSVSADIPIIELFKNIRLKSTHDIEKTVSIYSRLKRLSRETGDTAAHHAQLLAVSDKEKNAAVLAKLGSLVSSQRFQPASEWMRHEYLSDETDWKDGASDVSLTGKQDIKTSRSGEPREKGNATYTYDQNSLLLRILDIPGNVLKYVASNKIKSAVFLVGSIFIIYILALLIRSRFHN